MYRKILALTFMVAFAFQIFRIAAPTNADDIARNCSSEVDLSSVESGPDGLKKVKDKLAQQLKIKCTAVLKSSFFKKKTFDSVRFEEELSALTKKSAIDEQDIHDALASPEKFLATIETVAQRESGRGYGFSHLIKELSRRDLKDLYRILNQVIEAGSLSSHELDALLLKTYRVFHKPRTFWGTLFKSKSAIKAIDEIDDQVIRERIEYAIHHDGLKKAFQIIVTDDSWREKFAEVLDKNKKWIDLGLAASAWGALTYFAGELTLPPYLPTLSSFANKDLPPEALRAAREEGLDSAVELARPEIRPRLRAQRVWTVVKRGYFIAFSAVFIFSYSPQIFNSVEKQVEGTFQEVAESRFNENQQAVQKLAEKAQMTAEQRGEESFRQFVEILKEQGQTVDINSPQMQAEKARRIENYRQIIAEIERTHEAKPSQK